jgi:hypothetical protein
LAQHSLAALSKFTSIAKFGEKCELLMLMLLVLLLILKSRFAMPALSAALGET